MVRRVQGWCGSWGNGDAGGAIGGAVGEIVWPDGAGYRGCRRLYRVMLRSSADVRQYILRGPLAESACPGRNAGGGVFGGGAGLCRCWGAGDLFVRGGTRGGCRAV